MEKMQRLRSSATSVFIAEANQMNCQLIDNALRARRAQVFVAGTAVSSERTLDQLGKTAADVLIVSERLQEGPLEGYRLLRQLHVKQPKTRGVMLLESRNRDAVIDAFRCGARGVIFRDEPLVTLTKCIRVVDRGQFWVNTEHLGYLLEALGKSLPIRLQNARGLNLLSKREADAVHLVAQGLTNREISQRLKLSEHTVRNYLFRVFDKLGVSTRVELALYYLQENESEQVPAPPMRSTAASYRNNNAIAG
jgi:two-component system nitrate/nitrite response regulator NarL